MDFLSRPWPWYVASPLIGLTVPFVFLYAGRKWGISSTFCDVCVATAPQGLEYFRYSWRERGAWRLIMAIGLMIGGFLAGLTTTEGQPISAETQADLAALGITNVQGLFPAGIFSWSGLATPPGFVIIIGGGFLVGFGARYANGCTSGHGISGLSALRVTSLVAVLGFFAGGLLSTHFLLLLILRGGF